MDDDEETRVIHDQPYDESMDVADGEEVASVFSPVPPLHKKKPPAPDMAHLSRERPIQQRHDSPNGSLEDENNDDTQDESESNPNSAQMMYQPTEQKEYKSPDMTVFDPKMYLDLPVSADVKDIFQLIEKYQPQDIMLETKLKPFIPEYMPAIGDIDAFLKVPRPDGKVDHLGLDVLDEPSAKQSDPHVLNLQMRYSSKQPVATSLPTSVRNVSNADKNPKAIEEWIDNISKLQKSKTTDTVQYRKPMPNIDHLMQEWPTQFEELIKEASAPPADLDTDLATYTDIVCSLLDIPVYESRIQSLHALFTLYLGFKNSEHFKAMLDLNEPVNPRTTTDQLIID